MSSSRPDKYWMVFGVKADGGIANGRKFADVTKEPGEGVPDGMKVDRAGNIYGTARTGIYKVRLNIAVLVCRRI